MASNKVGLSQMIYLFLLRFECLRVSYNYIVQFQMEEMSQRHSQEQQYCLNEVVWAKITGFPWWPAQITAIPSQPNHHFRVDFFADTTHAFVSYTKIAKYQDLRHRIGNKTIKKDLKKAVTQADSVFNEVGRHSSVMKMHKSVVAGGAKHQDQQCDLLLNKQIQLSENEAWGRQNVQFDNSSPQNQQFIDREQYVHSLLRKYNLHEINVFEKKEPHRSKRILRPSKKNQFKCKRIAKVQQVRQPTIFLLSRRLYRLLLNKQNMSQSERRAISLNLCRQIQISSKSHAAKQGQEVFRMLKWISISPSSIITTYYQSWSSLQTKEDGSHVTTDPEQ